LYLVGITKYQTMYQIFLYLICTLIFSPSYFKDCKDCSRKQMMEHYRPMIQYVSLQTDLPQHFIWGYFIIETGGNSNALVRHNNPAGIKNPSKPLGDGRYAIETYTTPVQGIEQWVRVLSLGIYKEAKAHKGEELYKEMGYIYHPNSSHILRYQVGKAWK
jgi:hypothetical protein